MREAPSDGTNSAHTPTALIEILSHTAETIDIVARVRPI
jgi:hypothetical protein